MSLRARWMEELDRRRDEGRYRALRLPAGIDFKDVAPFYDQPTNRDWQFEAPWTGAAGIEVQHAIACLLLRNVTVA